METILPTYDKEKVHLSDMKKLAKWYTILNGKNLVEELTAEKTKEEGAKEEGSTEKKEINTPKKEETHRVTQSYYSQGEYKTCAGSEKRSQRPREAN